MTTSRHSSRGQALNGFVALVALAAVVIGVPTAMIRLGAIPHGIPSLRSLAHDLSTRDDSGEYFRVAAAAAVWVAWALFTGCAAREAVAAAHYRGPRPTVPRHRLQRVGPAALVAAVAALFLATPTFVLPISHASAGVLRQPTVNSSFASSSPASSVEAPDSGDASAANEQSPTYTVQRYDTLWSIAERHLPGNPAQRYKDIRRLNEGLVGEDNIIVSGTTLRLPADAFGLPGSSPETATTEREVTVEPADTLSGLASENGISDWHEVWDENRDRAEPHGARFVDPDHIEPGWTIDIRVPASPAPTNPPTTAAPTAPADPGTPSNPSVTSSQSSQDPTPLTTPAPSTTPVLPTATATASPAQSATSLGQMPASRSTHHEAGLSWQELFVGAGALLAAGLLGTLTTYRRRQHRFRRSGRNIPAAPPQSVPVERALIATAPNDFSPTEFLERSLRGLAAATAAAPGGELPNVLAARLHDRQLVLYLAARHRSAPPGSWTTDVEGIRWSITAGAEAPDTPVPAADLAAPYPALVTIGSDSEGGTWLLDLEAVGVLSVTGDHERCLDFGRFLAAEIAVNSWSDQVKLTAVGLGNEVAQLNPRRLSATDDLVAAIDAAATEVERAGTAQEEYEVDVLAGRLLGIASDLWRPHLLLAAAPEASTSTESLHLSQIRSFASSRGGRQNPVAIVLLGSDFEPGNDSVGLRAIIGTDARLRIPRLDLVITAHQMTDNQVGPISQLLSHAAELRDEPMPPSSGEADYEQLSDAAGAIRTEFTLPRNDPEPTQNRLALSTAGNVRGAAAELESSLLDLDDDTYLNDTATTAADLSALAPRVPPEVRAKVRDADPTLDDDVASWFDPECDQARLTLLGPVELRAHGERTADVQRRTAYYTELAAYLATRDHGATAEQVAEAFNVATSTAYSRLAVLKAWLGTNPRTGERHLPDATKSPAGRARGIGIYQLEGVLIDADLFKRLRLRGQARGTTGISDLSTALTLVSGPPFDQLRSGGYDWLIEGNRLDHIYVAAIVDVAHILAIHGLAADDLDTARAATEIALLAAPYEEKPRLDLVAIRHAEGRAGAATAYLRSEVCNRSDDGDAPLDLSTRTQEILRRREWLTRAG